MFQVALYVKLVEQTLFGLGQNLIYNRNIPRLFYGSSEGMINCFIEKLFSECFEVAGDFSPTLKIEIMCWLAAVSQVR